MTPVRLEPATPQSQGKHFTTEPLRSLPPFDGTSANSTDPDQTPYNVVSDQGLHCLLTECSIKILGLFKDFVTVYKNYKLMKNIDLPVKILFLKCYNLR